MTDKKIETDNDLVMKNIFGNAPETNPVEPVDPPVEPVDPVEPPIEPTNPPVVNPPVDPVEPIDPVVDPVDPVEPPPVDFDSLPEEKVLELFNKKFNTNFDTMEAANQLMESKLEIRGQEDIIKKLVEKQKDTNVLSYFGSENSYKVNQLEKEYPGKRATLDKVINSDIASLTDFEVIELAERMAKPADTKVDVLGVKLRTSGISDSIVDFEDWDNMDKQVVMGMAEDAREVLGQLQSKVEVPKEGESEVDTFVAELESGFQTAKETRNKSVETNKPIVESLVDSLTKIKPVEGLDFEFDIALDAEAKKDYLDYLLAESVEGGYDIKADKDVRNLQGMLEKEVWANDGPKIMKAYGKYIEEKTTADVTAKFNNEVPLDNSVPPTDPNAPAKIDDNDHAKALLGG